jgi:uncharacterized membrane protein
VAHLVAIAYDDMDQAESVMRSIGELVKEHSLTLEDAVIVEHKANGKLKLHQPSLTGIGAASGALWGGVIGLLFLAPVLGMAVGVDDDFVKELGEQLPQGGAAVVVLVQESTRDKVVPEISKHGGRLIQSSLSNDQEEALQQALDNRAVAGT